VWKDMESSGQSVSVASGTIFANIGQYSLLKIASDGTYERLEYLAGGVTCQNQFLWSSLGTISLNGQTMTLREHQVEESQGLCTSTAKKSLKPETHTYTVGITAHGSATTSRLTWNLRLESACSPKCERLVYPLTLTGVTSQKPPARNFTPPSFTAPTVPIYKDFVGLWHNASFPYYKDGVFANDPSTFNWYNPATLTFTAPKGFVRWIRLTEDGHYELGAYMPEISSPGPYCQHRAAIYQRGTTQFSVTQDLYNGARGELLLQAETGVLIEQLLDCGAQSFDRRTKYLEPMFMTYNYQVYDRSTELKLPCSDDPNKNAAWQFLLCDDLYETNGAKYER
jgi:hypothetical protein